MDRQTIASKSRDARREQRESTKTDPIHDALTPQSAPRGPNAPEKVTADRTPGFNASKESLPSPAEVEYGPPLSAEDGILIEDDSFLYGDPNKSMIDNEDAAMIEHIDGINDDGMNHDDREKKNDRPHLRCNDINPGQTCAEQRF